jgi:hypothetical protein
MIIRLAIKWVKLLLINVLVGFVILELFSFFLVKNNMLIINETPNIYRKVKQKDDGSIAKNWLTENNLWGAWHKKNAIAQHNGQCFKSEYRSNSIGARDDEFMLNEQKNFILLGDSFAEGYGVNFEETSQKIIENQTNLNVLNFGASGNLGPLQYWLLYKELAKKYPHDGLIIYFLPSNDFNDNDYDYWNFTGQTFNSGKKSGAERYRPYYSIQGDEYAYFIPSNAIKKESWEDRGGLITKFIIENLWLGNTLRTLKTIILRQFLINKINSTSTSTSIYSGYFDATHDQQKAAVYFLKKIIEDSPASLIFIISIPILEDFNRAEHNPNHKNLFWVKALKNLKVKNKKIKFIDLLSYKPNSAKDLFFACDNHWNSKGNSWAGEIISSEIKNEFN